MTRKVKLGLLPVLVFIGWIAIGGASRAVPAVTLTAVTASPAPSRPNLLDNAGFESALPDDLPAGWSWDKRNTNATARLDETVAHSGHRSLHLTNGTPFGANVYGTLWRNQPIHLQVGHSYTLSAYLRSSDLGNVWIGGGSTWQFRLFPPSKMTPGRWQHVQMTFVPGPADTEFTLRIGTDSPTRGLWIDDLKLEQGSMATPDPPQGEGAALDPTASGDADPVVQADGPWNIGFDLVTAQPLTDARLQATVQQRGAGKPLFLESPMKLAVGTWHINVRGLANQAETTPYRITLTIVESGQEIAQSEDVVRFLSPLRGLNRLAPLRHRLSDVKKQLDTVRAQGQDPAYPLVSFTVLQNFVGYVEEDLHSSEVPRAFQELTELEAMESRVEQELHQALIGHRLPGVPRWAGKARPRISGPAFLAPVSFPTRRAKPAVRPVLFIGYGHFDQVKKDIEKFPGYGINIIQFEIGPRDVFPREGVVSLTAVRETRRILDRAAKAGVAVDLLVSPHYMPDWMLAKYPELRKKREGFLQYCLHAPEGEAFLKRYLAVVIPPLRASPALHSICLSNEPINVEEPDPFAAADWHAWLQKRHGGIDTLNARWGTHYADFEAVPLPDPREGSSPEIPRPSPLWYEFVLFNQEFFAGWHRMLADTIHALAPGLPVCAKPMTWTFLNENAARFGVDAELFGAMTDINGNDSEEYYNYDEGDFAADFVPSEEAYDLQRSVKDAPVFNSENHVIPDRETRAVPAEHLRSLLWQGAMHGQSATTIWVWERTTDRKSDIYGNIMHHPAAAEAVGRVSHDLNRFAPEVTALQRLPPQVMLLQSATAGVWDGSAYTDCLHKLYTALAFTGLQIGFVTERQLIAGRLPKTALLLVPNITHLPTTAYAALGRYRGQVVIVGGKNTLGRDEYDRPRPGRLARVVTIPFQYGPTSWRDLQKPLLGALAARRTRPPVQVCDDEGKPLWGVEWRCVPTPRGVVVSLCNYRQSAVSLTLWQPGLSPSSPHRPLGPGTDLLRRSPLLPEGTTKQARERTIRLRLQPLETKLCLFPSDGMGIPLARNHRGTKKRIVARIGLRW